MTDIYKELEEEIALAGGIDKLVASDIAKMKLYRGYTPEQALAEASSPIRQAEADLNEAKLERLRSEFDRDLERQKEHNKRQDRMLQGLVDEYSRRTKVRLLSIQDPGEMEDAINEFLYDRQIDGEARFSLIDIKYSGTSTVTEALIIYSEIDKPKEEEEV